MAPAAAVLAALTFGVAACGDDSSDSSGKSAGSKGPIVLAGLKGEAAEGGPDFMDGMQIAVDEINKAGGVEGRKLQLKYYPTGGTPDGSASAYRSAGQDSKVLGAFLGAAGGMAVRAQTDRVRLPIIAAAGADGVDKPVKKYVFQNSSGSEYATSSLNYAVTKLGVKTVAALHYGQTDFSAAVPSALKGRCPELGCKIVAVEQAGAADSASALTPQLTKLKRSGADAYYIESLNPAALATARQLGMFDRPVIAEEWLTVPAIAQATGAASKDVVFGGGKCRAPDILQPTDPVKKACEDYVALYKSVFPDRDFALFSVYGYDAVRLYADAARRLITAGKEITRDNMVSALESFDGKSMLTTQGTVKSSPDNHRLTGSWHEGNIDMALQVNGKKVKWVLAPKADPAGGHP